METLAPHLGRSQMAECHTLSMLASQLSWREHFIVYGSLISLSRSEV